MEAIFLSIPSFPGFASPPSSLFAKHTILYNNKHIKQDLFILCVHYVSSPNLNFFTELSSESALDTTPDSTANFEKKAIEPPPSKRHKTEDHDFNLSHSIAASFRPGKLTGIEILSRLFPLQKRDVLELVLQGCNGDALKAIEHFLSVDEGSSPDDVKDDTDVYTTNTSRSSILTYTTEALHKPQELYIPPTYSRSNSLSQSASILVKTNSVANPLNLNWEYSSQPDIYSQNWPPFRFGANLFSNKSSPTHASRSVLNNSHRDQLLSCFPAPPIMHPPMSPFYYSMATVRPPSFK